MQPTQPRAKLQRSTSQSNPLYPSEKLYGLVTKHSILNENIGRFTIGYVEKVKRDFLWCRFNEEAVNRKKNQQKSTNEDYIKQKLAEEATTELMKYEQICSLQDVLIVPGTHFNGSTRVRKKGANIFCCCTNVNQFYLDLYLDEDGDLIFKPMLPPNQLKNVKFYHQYNGQYRDIKVVDVDNIVSNQSSEMGRKRIGKELELLVVPPTNANYRWVYAFSNIEQTKDTQYFERSFFYFRNDEELFKFKNTMMGSSDFGKKFLQSKETKSGVGGPFALMHIIHFRKVAVSETLYKSMARMAESWIKKQETSASKIDKSTTGFVGKNPIVVESIDITVNNSVHKNNIAMGAPVTSSLNEKKPVVEEAKTTSEKDKVKTSKNDETSAGLINQNADSVLGAADSSSDEQKEGKQTSKSKKEKDSSKKKILHNDDNIVVPPKPKNIVEQPKAAAVPLNTNTVKNEEKEPLVSTKKPIVEVAKDDSAKKENPMTSLLSGFNKKNNTSTEASKESPVKGQETDVKQPETKKDQPVLKQEKVATKEPLPTNASQVKEQPKSAVQPAPAPAQPKPQPEMKLADALSNTKQKITLPSPEPTTKQQPNLLASPREAAPRRSSMSDSKSPKNGEKKKVHIRLGPKDKQSLIKMLVIKKHIQKHLKNQQVLKEKVSTAFGKRIKRIEDHHFNFSRKNLLLEFKEKLNSASYVITPIRYIRLQAEVNDRVELLSLFVSEMHLTVSKKAVEKTNISKLHTEEKSMMQLELLPLTQDREIMQKEFSVYSASSSLILTGYNGQTLWAYLRTSHEGKITHAGNVKIAEENKSLVVVELFALSKTGTIAPSTPPVGVILCQRGSYKYSPITFPTMKTLLKVQNYAFMNNYLELQTFDRKLPSISGYSSAAEKYSSSASTIRRYLNFCMEVDDFYNLKVREEEWTYFEKQILKRNLKISKRLGKDSPIVNSAADFLRVIKPLYKKEQLTSTVGDRSSIKGLSYFSRDHWKDFSEYTDEKDITDRAMMISAPEYLLIPVWKSLGKLPIISQIVTDICKAKLPKFNPAKSVLDQLANESHEELHMYPNIERDLHELVREESLSAAESTKINKIVRAFLKLSLLMEEVTEDDSVEDNILKGFNFRPFESISDIVRHLLELEELSRKNASSDERCSAVTEDDSFWVLLLIAFVFLPEHFLNPLPNYTPTDKMLNFYSQLSQFSMNFEKLQKQKLFISTSTVGSYKLSLILPSLIHRLDSAVYTKLQELGYPLVTYCIDCTEKMFIGQFRPSVLSAIWNLIFFEGADRVKRRGQQIMLCTLAASIIRCKKLILQSRCCEEVSYFLSASTFLNNDYSSLISDVFSIRKTHLVFGSNESVAAALKSEFDLSIEDEFKKIKGKLFTIYEPIAGSNRCFVTFLMDILNKKQQDEEEVNIRHLQTLVDRFNLSSNPQNKKVLRLTFDNTFTSKRCLFGDKPSIDELYFGINSWSAGDFNPSSIVLSVVPSFDKSSGFSMSYKDANWYETTNFKAGLAGIIAQPSRAWVDIKLEGMTMTSDIFEVSKRIVLSRLRYNTNTYFTFNYENMWMIICIKITSTEIMKDKRKYESIEALDLMQEMNLIGSFCDHLGLTQEIPFCEELLCNICEKDQLQSILSYAYEQGSIDLSQEFINSCLQGRLLGAGSETLFECLVKLIVFSPMDHQVMINCLFNLLWKLDLSPQPGRVKRTHVEFLVWYVLRLMGVCLPYSDAVTQIEMILKGSVTYVESAALICTKDGHGQEIDLTELFNLWMTCMRRCVGVSALLIGGQDDLGLFKLALEFWVKSKKIENVELGENNRLLITLRNGTSKLTFDKCFDSKMNLINNISKDDQSINSSKASRIVLLLADSEELLDMASFTKILWKFQVLDLAFSRMAGISGNTSTQLAIRQNAKETYNTKTQYKVIVDFEKTSEQEIIPLAKVNLVNAKINTAYYTNINQQNIDFLRSLVLPITKPASSQLAYDLAFPKLQNIECLTKASTLKSIVKLAQDAVLEELSKQLKSTSSGKENLPYLYSKDSLLLTMVQPEDLSLFVDSKPLSYELLESTLEDAYKKLLPNSANSTLTIQARIKPDSLPKQGNRCFRSDFTLQRTTFETNPLQLGFITSLDSRTAKVQKSATSDSQLIPPREISYPLQI